ncbi:hypothetical protein ACFVYA_49005 [Amycolatopsis sp. NPDC058278]|uniref:hypothetical protein n=1 Tax=Amycolatopsis sp. NPDC058278 TaxID=3346417 RepID=UPI0036DB5512
MTLISTDLVDGIDERRYFFTEHRLGPGDQLFSAATGGFRTFLVVGGSVNMDGRSFVRLQGWHVAPDGECVVRNNESEAARVLEAGAYGGTQAAATQATREISGYTVSKPWGEETWYTHNLAEPRYALKRIHMRAGNQSSLQSHVHKVETNYVIEGRATVLGGSPAPPNPGAAIDLSTLGITRYIAGTGWTSPATILHRVIAEEEYTAIEVSTPELDDVIRWADDTGRCHGRIASEHLGGTA